MTTNNEMRAARERGDEICHDGHPVEALTHVHLMDDVNTLSDKRWTARPRKPKEFDLWEAGRRVCNGEAIEMRGPHGALVMNHGALAWKDTDSEMRACSQCLSAKWTLIGNDGKPVYE